MIVEHIDCSGLLIDYVDNVFLEKTTNFRIIKNIRFKQSLKYEKKIKLNV